MSERQQGPYDSIARRWLALAERRQAHFIELVDSGRWRHYFTPEVLNAEMRKAALLRNQWTLASSTDYYPINGADQNWACNSPTFVPTTLSGTFNRPLNLSDARLDTGIISTSATGSGTSYGIARTAGTSYALVGAATSASAVTTKAMWEVTIAPTYVAASTLPVIVNANYTGAGTVTAASTTLTLTAYTEVGGVETAITGITAAQQFTGTAANYTFNIPSSAALAPNQHIVVEVTMLVTTSAGAATGQINGVSVTD